MNKTEATDAEYEIIYDKNDIKTSVVGSSIVILLFFFLLMCAFLCSCSLSLHNIQVKDAEVSPKFDSIFPSSSPTHAHE